ncbi:MAG TPA: glycine zipper 2TM domain-containing protein [Steroidobacteraceae bacterium]|nr:glycine zipper 2TM domain-containing protein [Steroidobacteraceae bacterium]
MDMRQGVLGVVASLGVCGAAMAHGHDDDRYRNRGAEYGDVTRVRQVVRSVPVSVPVQQCYRDGGYRHPHGGALLGGLIGATIGHNLAFGPGRGPATVAGAVIGSAIGRDAERRAADDRGGYDRGGYCETRYETRYEPQIAGYEVTYCYRGRTYRTHLDHDPGRRLPLPG